MNAEQWFKESDELRRQYESGEISWDKYIDLMYELKEKYECAP